MSIMCYIQKHILYNDQQSLNYLSVNNIVHTIFKHLDDEN